MSDILTVKKIEKKFGELIVVNDLSFEVHRGEILGMMGPNGAGKTTVFNLLTGAIQPDKGAIIFNGRDIIGESPARRCKKGIGRTYQIPQPFEKMTVFENLLVGAVHGGRIKKKHARQEVDEILELIDLSSVRNQWAGSLSLLDRKRLELGRALATQPSLILLDEIAGGLTEAEMDVVLHMVKEIQKKGVTIVWIEHLMMMMTKGVDRLLVISEGAWLNCGNPEEVLNSTQVQECYFGSEEA